MLQLLPSLLKPNRLISLLAHPFGLLGVISHTWKTTVTVPGLATLPTDPPVVISGPYAVDVEFSVPPSSVSLELDIATVPFAKIISIVINADKAAMDVFTNAADGTGGQHFALAANKSVSWNNSQLPTFINPITANITKLFANNASASVTGVLRIGILLEQ